MTDDGLWDVRKGWSLPVSGYIVARNRWRDAYKFASCKSCKGVGGYISKAVLLFKELTNKSSILYDKKDEKRSHKHNKIDSSHHSNGSISFIMNTDDITSEDNNKNLNTDSSDSHHSMKTNNNNNNNLRNSFLMTPITFLPTSVSLSSLITESILTSTSAASASASISNAASIPISTLTTTLPSTSTSAPYQTPASIKRQAAIVAATMIDTKHRLLWKVPELLVSFLSNLPINLCGITPHNKSWAVRQLYQILNMKRINDKEDIDMGLGVQVNRYTFYHLLKLFFYCY